jgi:tetratricopeptide (TPR) repeat protein
MKRCVILFVWAFALGTAGSATGQEAEYSEDLRFVRELRARRYNDLALEYLEKLRAKNPNKEQASELALEIARARLDASADEPDSAKRLVLYTQAKAEFEQFLKDNLNNPASGEVKLDLAQVAVQQGRTQLSRAWLQDTPNGRIAEMLKARTLLEDAGKLIRGAAGVLDGQLEKVKGASTDADKKLKAKLEDARLRAEVSAAVNLIDQAQTFDESQLNEQKARAAKVQEAVKLLEKLGGGDNASPVTWTARAWLGRCTYELGEPKKARAKYNEVNEATGAAPAEGQRLARYFRLLAMKEQPDALLGDSSEKIVTSAKGWIADYPSYANTPEGQGVRFLLAEVYMGQANDPKSKLKPDEKAKILASARKLLTEIERSENEFTDRAHRKKIEIIREQGGLDRKVEELKTFEDCYVRAQYELHLIGVEVKEIKDDKERAAKRKQHFETVLQALKQGLSQKDAQAREHALEANNARAMLAFCYLDSGKYEEAIKVAEAFARDNPKASQAATAAMYALQAHSKLIAAKEEMSAPKEELEKAREALQKWVAYVEQRWPKEPAADMARELVGLSLLREKKLAEAAQLLDRITPSYASYPFVQYKLAEALLDAEREKKPDRKPGEYRNLAVHALSKIPDASTGADGAVNRVFVKSRFVLGTLLFLEAKEIKESKDKEKKYLEVDNLARTTLEKLPSLPFDNDPKLDEAIRKQLGAELVVLRMHAQFGLAETAFTAGNHAEVVRLLDPFVDKAKAGELPFIKENRELASGLLSLALRSNVHLGKLDRARIVLQVQQSLSEDGGDAASLAILRQLSAIIKNHMEELARKNDPDTLAKTKAGFADLLTGLAKQAKPSTEFTLLMAQNYSHLEEHAKAIEMIEKLPEPGEKPDENTLKLHHAGRLMLVRELRLNKDVKKAKTLLEEIMGDKAKPGWGAKNVDVLIERVLIHEAEEEYFQGAKLADSLVKQLHQPAQKDNHLKEKYLECYYHVTYCFVNHAKGMTDKAKAEKTIKDAAEQIVKLEQGIGFGNDASAKRFQDLLAKEPALKEQYEKLKGGK